MKPLAATQSPSETQSPSTQSGHLPRGVPPTTRRLSHCTEKTKVERRGRKSRAPPPSGPTPASTHSNGFDPIMVSMVRQAGLPHAPPPPSHCRPGLASIGRGISCTDLSPPTPAPGSMLLFHHAPFCCIADIHSHSPNGCARAHNTHTKNAHTHTHKLPSPQTLHYHAPQSGWQSISNISGYPFISFVCLLPPAASAVAPLLVSDSDRLGYSISPVSDSAPLRVDLAEFG